MRIESMMGTGIGLIGSVLFTILLCTTKIGQASYIVLLLALALFSLVIHGFSRLRELDLKNLKLTLYKIDQAKREIFAKEEDLKEASIKLLELILFNSEWSSRIADEKSMIIRNGWNREKAREVMKAFSVEPALEEHVFRYCKAFSELDNEQNRDKHRVLRDRINAMMKEESETDTGALAMQKE